MAKSDVNYFSSLEDTLKTVDEDFVRDLDKRFRSYLSDEITPRKIGKDAYQEMRGGLISELKSLPDNGSSMIGHYVQEEYNKIFGAEKGKPRVKFYPSDSHNDRWDLPRKTKIEELDQEHLRILHESQFLQHLIRPATIGGVSSLEIVKGKGKDLKENDELLDYLSKEVNGVRPPLVKKLHKVNRFTDMVDFSYFAHFAAVYNKIFDIYREDGSIKDARKKEELCKFNSGYVAAYQKTISYMAGLGLPTFVMESRWLDEKESPAYVIENGERKRFFLTPLREKGVGGMID